MAFQQKEGQGSLFKNEKQNDRQPDFKGSIMIKGVLYDIAAWNRTSQNGRSYLSLQASEKAQDSNFGGSYQPQRQPSYPQYQPAPAPTIDDMPPVGPDDDLPF